MEVKRNTNNTKQAFWISLGSVFAFGFTLISSMILSRYFTKEEYGTYKQVLYVYNTLLIVFTLGLPKTFSYFLPRVSIDQARSLIKKITNLLFLMGAIFSILLFLSASSIATFLNNPDLELPLKIFSPVPLLMLPTMGLEGIFATYRRTQFIALYNILSKVFMLLCVALPVVLFKGAYIQAIIGLVISSFINFLIALYIEFLPVKNAGTDRCSITYKEIFKFSLPLMYAGIWGIIISSADQFFISRFFGTNVFAEFSNGSLELPFVGMIITATSTVLMPLFSKQIYDKEDPKKVILPVWKNVFEKTVKLIYPLVLFCWFFADTLMIVLYGQKYEESGIYFRIKLIVNFFTLISYYPLIIAMRANKFYANVHLIHAIFLIILDVLCIKLFSSPYLITIISVICRIGNVFCMLLYISNYFNIRLLELIPLRLMLNIFIPSVIMLLLIKCFLTSVLSINNILQLGGGSILYFTFFYVWTIYKKMDYWSIIKPLFSKLNK
ncbi:MAG TPA: hypothetical protein DEG28_13255 [Porphyromonadaceae bacterium]|nr:hypothetical protein [Porphyromonadaceae bacterium]